MENKRLNLIPSSYLPEVHLSQYDKGRILTFKLMDGASEYTIPSGATITVKATKPSGQTFCLDGLFYKATQNISAGGTVQVGTNAEAVEQFTI